MKNQLSKKLYAFIVTAMMFSASANAQIVYTDVNPDVTINTNGGVYALDLNNDGITDFNITYSTAIFVGQTNRYINITPLGTNKVGNGLSVHYPSALPLNTLIDSSSFYWSSNANQSLISRIWFQTPHGQWVWQTRGNWNGASNKYVPLQLNLNSQKYYGWARLDAVTNAVSFTVKDYAYNTIPNQLIRAGETSCATPTVNLTQSGSLSFCNGDSVTFTANGTGYQYQWKKNNINIAGATAQTYVAKTAGVYKCKVINSCGSKTSGTRTVTVPCRITNENMVETLEQLSVYPNPAISTVTIKFHSDSYENGEQGEIQIVNLFGQIVYSEKVNVAQTTNLPIERGVDVSRFAVGMYMIRWSSGENFETKTFSVIK
ncbi:MAG: T9SS type A sorting domain-containing protein [Bacteroidia bacterium]